MYSALTADAIETLERIERIVADNPCERRVTDLIERLKTTAASVMSTSQGVADTRSRSSAHALADGLSAAAEICGRLQDGRS